MNDTPPTSEEMLLWGKTLERASKDTNGSMFTMTKAELWSLWSHIQTLEREKKVLWEALKTLQKQYRSRKQYAHVPAVEFTAEMYGITKEALSSVTPPL